MLAGDLDALERLVHGASAIKAELIARDPYERDSRRTLGFGHAIAHPLETVTGYSALLHGEAVAFGMVVESRIAAARGLLDADGWSASCACCARSGCRPPPASSRRRSTAPRCSRRSSASG